MKIPIALEPIERRICLLRGRRVMLDTHRAELYGVKAFRLREQVGRNRARFPVDFMFQLSEDEAASMVSQKAIPSRQHLGGYLPYASRRKESPRYPAFCAAPAL